MVGVSNGFHLALLQKNTVSFLGMVSYYDFSTAEIVFAAVASQQQAHPGPWVFYGPSKNIPHAHNPISFGGRPLECFSINGDAMIMQPDTRLVLEGKITQATVWLPEKAILGAQVEVPLIQELMDLLRPRVDKGWRVAVLSNFPFRG